MFRPFSLLDHAVIIQVYQCFRDIRRGVVSDTIGGVLTVHMDSWWQSVHGTTFPYHSDVLIDWGSW